MIKEYILAANDTSLEHNDTMLVEKMKSGALNEFEKIPHTQPLNMSDNRNTGQ